MVGWGVKTNKSKDIGMGYTVGGHYCKQRWSDFINYAKVSLLSSDSGSCTLRVGKATLTTYPGS